MKIHETPIQLDLFDEQQTNTIKARPIFVNNMGEIMRAQTLYFYEKIEKEGVWRSINTVRSYICSIKHFSMFIESIKVPLTDITMRELLAWRNKMINHEVRESNLFQRINLRLSHVVNFIDWSIKHHYIQDQFVSLSGEDKLSFRGVKFNQTLKLNNRLKTSSIRTGPQVASRLPSMPEVQEFLSNLQSETRLIARCILETGMRINEVLSLPLKALPDQRTWENDLARIYLIKLSTNKKGIKHNQNRQVYVSGFLCQALHFYCQETRLKRIRKLRGSYNPLFISPKLKSWSSSAISNQFSKALKQSGLTVRITSNVLRQVFQAQILASLQNRTESENLILTRINSAPRQSYLNAIHNAPFSVSATLKDKTHQVYSKPQTCSTEVEGGNNE